MIKKNASVKDLVSKVWNSVKCIHGITRLMLTRIIINIINIPQHLFLCVPSTRFITNIGEYKINISSHHLFDRLSPLCMPRSYANVRLVSSPTSNNISSIHRWYRCIQFLQSQYVFCAFWCFQES